MNETTKKSVYDLLKMVTDDPQNSFELEENLIYEKDGQVYIHYFGESIPIEDFCMKKLCTKFDCIWNGIKNDSVFPETMKDEILSDCAVHGCPVAYVHAAFSGYARLRDRLRMYENAMNIPE